MYTNIHNNVKVWKGVSHYYTQNFFAVPLNFIQLHQKRSIHTVLYCTNYALPKYQHFVNLCLHVYVWSAHVLLPVSVNQLPTSLTSRPNSSPSAQVSLSLCRGDEGRVGLLIHNVDSSLKDAFWSVSVLQDVSITVSLPTLILHAHSLYTLVIGVWSAGGHHNMSSITAFTFTHSPFFS